MTMMTTTIMAAGDTPHLVVRNEFADNLPRKPVFRTPSD